MKIYLSLGVLLVVVLMNQQCSPVHMNSAQDSGPLSKSEGGLAAEAETPISDGEEIDNEVADTEEMDVECIGNGIKVPISALTDCSDGSDKCLFVCAGDQSTVITYHQGRIMIPAGAMPGQCM